MKSAFFLTRYLFFCTSLRLCYGFTRDAFQNNAHCLGSICAIRLSNNQHYQLQQQNQNRRHVGPAMQQQKQQSILWALRMVPPNRNDGVEEFGFDKDPLKAKRAEFWVLVVDDEESIRKAVGQFLFNQGYQVTACPDGASALKVATSKVTQSASTTETTTTTDNDNNNNNSNGLSPVQKVPDCIVSDIRMPGMDGIELLKRMRDDKLLVEVPVVLLTAKGMTQDRITGYDAGADAYLSKPFDPEELVAIIDNVIDRHQTLNGAKIQVDDLKRDLDEIKFLLLEKGGGGVGNGFVEQTNVFLAPDERQVLEFLCQGLLTKEIADKTYLSTRRVEQLLTRMFRKTGVKNRTELVRWAVATGNVRL